MNDDWFLTIGEIHRAGPMHHRIAEAQRRKMARVLHDRLKRLWLEVEDDELPGALRVHLGVICTELLKEYAMPDRG